ncbi:MAG: hypothetical protein KDB53_12945 [Planctomycetes bacterium]|nr:hypothetical protein [Planctomycetota bacterium]
MTAETIWRELLEADRETWIAGIPDFRDRLRAARICFGDRQLCNHLRPKFLTETEYSDLVLVSEAVLAGIMQAKDRLLADPILMDMLGVREDEKPLIAIDPGYAHIAPCVRLDSFITADGPQFVELNGECPAGPAYGYRLAQNFEAHPLMQAFKQRVPCRPIDTLRPLLDTLLSCYREWGGTKRPTIGIIDYDYLPTVHEFELCREYFVNEGYDCVVADPRHLEYDGERLVGGGKQIDLVYKRVLVNEFIEKTDEVAPLHDAFRDRKVCMVNPFRSKLVHKKAIFAVLTSDGRDEWMGKEQQTLIDRAVPWTRNVREGKTRIEGREVDLIPYLAQHRDDFVLKPNDEYGGKGITIGWEANETAWEQALNAALKGDFVAQRRLYMVGEAFPSMLDGLSWGQLFVDLDPYMYLGHMHGALARLGVGSLCNVTSGGGQVPLFITS